MCSLQTVQDYTSGGEPQPGGWNLLVDGKHSAKVNKDKTSTEKGKSRVGKCKLIFTYTVLSDVSTKNGFKQ